MICLAQTEESYTRAAALRNWRNCHHNMVADIRLAIRSETGILIQTPVCPQKRGRINRQGIRMSTWRVMERKIALLAIPILWKKLEVTI